MCEWVWIFPHKRSQKIQNPKSKIQNRKIAKSSFDLIMGVPAQSVARENPHTPIQPTKQDTMKKGIRVSREWQAPHRMNASFVSSPHEYL